MQLLRHVAQLELQRADPQHQVLRVEQVEVDQHERDGVAEALQGLEGLAEDFGRGEDGVEGVQADGVGARDRREGAGLVGGGGDELGGEWLRGGVEGAFVLFFFFWLSVLPFGADVLESGGDGVRVRRRFECEAECCQGDEEEEQQG